MSSNTPVSMEVRAGRELAVVIVCTMGVVMGLEFRSRGRGHDDSVFDRVKTLKYLKMMEQKGNKLVTGTAGYEVSYAWYLSID